MAEAAVAEQPTDTKTEATEATKGELENQPAADLAADVQTDEKPAATISPLLAAIQSGDESDMEARVQAAARKLLQQDKAEKRSTALRAKTADNFNKAISAMVEKYGLESEESQQPLYNAMNAAHLNVVQDATAAVREEYEEWLEDFIPEADREAYHKDTAGQSTEAKFKAAAEYLVTGTKAIKAMSLEDFSKHSTKGRSDLKAALVEADEAGYQRGLAAPAGDATGTAEKRAGSASTTYTTENDARAALVRGEITTTQFRQWLAARRS